MLNDISAVDNARGTLLNQFFGALEDFLVGSFASAADEDGNED